MTLTQRGTLVVAPVFIMKRFIRYSMVFLRIFPQDNYSEEKQEEATTIPVSASAKVIPVDYEEDQIIEDVTRNQVKDTVMVEVFNLDLEDETHPEISESGNNDSFNLQKRKYSDSGDIIIKKYEYYLRDEVDVDVDDNDITSVFSCYVMKSKMLEGSELFDIINDTNLIHNLHQIIFYEPLHDPKPKLPFTLESFVQYLFVESRDLKLIRVMLRVCQSFPIILAKYDQSLKARNNGTSLRDGLMLPFLINVHGLDKVSARSTIQLMGFKNIIQLMLYYEGYMHSNPIIADAMFILGYPGEGSVSENMDNYEYMHEYDMV